MRIAIYGGSFNPPHIGHVDAARAANEQLEPEKLLFVAAAVPPHKPLPPGSPGGEIRLELASLAAEGVPGAEASDIELRREGSSYTADTVDELMRAYPGAEIILLLGTDMFLNIESWHRARWLLENVALAVFARKDGQEMCVIDHGGALASKYGTKVYYINKAPLDVSSTWIRDALKRREGREFLPEKVYARIIKDRLYGARPEFEWLRERVRERLDQKRYAHVLGCAREAVKLAGRWGADKEDAEEAGILHDITKKLLPWEQLLLCEKYGILIDSVERQYPKLLHSKTGAAVARGEFGVSDEVFNAIQWHTTGHAGMTLLEKIIYIADYIEPNRSFDGLEQLRKLAYEDLDEAMRLGLEMSLNDIRSSGAQPHSNSIEALDWFSYRRER